VVEHGEITSRIVGRDLVIAAVMSLPRQVLPGQFYLVTRRCTQRQFLLWPDAATNVAMQAAAQMLKALPASMPAATRDGPA
jgi:hypothetical protein